jgi:spore germination protein YaaH
MIGLLNKGRSFLAVLTLLLGVQNQALAVRPLPFHSSAWITWIKPDTSSINLYGQNMDGLMVFAYHFDSNDNVITADPFVDRTLAQYRGDTQGGRRPTFVTIVNDIASGQPNHAGDIRHNGALIHRIFSDPAKRARHIEQLMALAPLADGIDIDYEALLPETYPYYTEFIKELRAAMKARYPEKLLSVCAQPKTSTVVGPRGQAIDWVGIEPHVDIIRILAYYYSWQGSRPGAVVSRAQVEALGNFAINNQRLPMEKIHMTFTMFGLDWPETGIGQFVEYSEAMALAQRYNAPLRRDPVNNDITFNYTDTAGVRHTVYVDDAESLIPKIMISLNQGIRHIDFWHLGTGDPKFWQWVAANTTNFPDPVDNVTPLISQLRPGTVAPGGPEFSLEVLGDNFENGAFVRVNGDPRPTTFSSATRLTVRIPASDIASPGSVNVMVSNPVNQNNSNQMPLNIVARPVINTLAPSSGRVQDNGMDITATGSGFTPNSIVQYNGTDRPTVYVGPTELRFTIFKPDLLERGTVPVRVANPASEGGLSAPKIFSVRLVPAVSALQPGQTAAGGPTFTLTLRGNRFATDSVVMWNGSPRETTFVSSRTIRAAITAADIASVGTARVVVSNPAPGGTSEARTFIINQPGAIVPTIFGLNPSGVRPGGPDVSVRVIGRDFIEGAVVKWEGSARPTTHVSANELVAQIPAADVAAPGKFGVTVTNPGPNGGTSAAFLFSVIASGPLITSVDPASVSAGGPAFTLIVRGLDFGSDSVLQWNGDPRPSTVRPSCPFRSQRVTSPPQARSPSPWSTKSANRPRTTSM